MPAHNSLRIGILGGLFDPPHIYHLISAQWILQEFDLKKIVFVPAYNPPHKSKYSSYIHRLRMIKMATRGNKDFLVSEVERYVKGKTYTVEVIKRLKSQQKFLFPLKISDLKAVEFYLIIGADQWNEITHWKDPARLFKECRIIVMPRPGFRIKRIKPFYKYILISNTPLMNISSTMIRNRIKEGLSIDYLVTPAVGRYIIRQNLYR